MKVDIPDKAELQSAVAISTFQAAKVQKKINIQTK
jgi:hypothetical protein